MSKNKKVISLLAVLILLLSFFVLPVSAEDSYVTVTNPYDYVYNCFKIDYLMLALYDEAGNRVGADFSLWQPSPTDYMVIYADLKDGNFMVGQKYRVVISLSVDDSLLSTDNYVVGSYDIACWDYYQKISALNTSYRSGFYGGNLTESQNSINTPEKNTAYGDMSGYNIKYNKGRLGLYYSQYMIAIDVVCEKERDVLGVYFLNFDFKQLSPDEAAVQEGLDQEKQEAQNSGSSASDDVASAVPDQSAGFTNALKTFVQSMSTTDTDCNIKLPAIVVPELEGLIPETALIDEQSINFSQAVSLIPEAIMKIVQSLTTIGLIVFCFKELYGTIEYILTMRKGGSNE